MLDNIKNKLTLLKINMLFNKGISEGLVTPFSTNFYNQMKTTYFNGIPIYIHIKYLKPILPPGKCYDRSLYMFFSIKDSIRVTADVKDLEIRFGEESAGHAWIEKDNYVYDPSFLKRFDKDLYYKIFEPKNIYKETKEEFDKRTNHEIDKSISKDIKDYKPHGKRRTDLLTQIPLIIEIAKNEDNESFINDLKDYLNQIQYDEEEVYQEFNQKYLTLKK